MRKYLDRIQFFCAICSMSMLLSCISKEYDKSSCLITVDLEQCMSVEKAVVLSDIVDTLEYIELKTPADIIITRILDIVPYENFLVIHSRDGLFKFTEDGEFVKILAKKGQGPGEYNMIFGITVDPLKKELILADSEKTIYYDLEGNFLRNVKTGNLFCIALKDTTLWATGLAHRTMEFMAVALNQRGDTIATMPNPYYGMESMDAGMGVSYSKYWNPFYHYKRDLYLKGKEHNDTVFKLQGKERIPYIYLDMGKYKLPIEYEPWYSYEAFLKEAYRYWAIPAVLEDDNFLYLLMQRCSSPTGNNFVHDENNFRYILYDKKKEQGFITNGVNGTRFTDDILGGPVFWPRWSFNDYYLNFIEWYDLSQEIKNGDYTLLPDFKNQFKNWGYDTNSLIIRARKKKQ